MNIFQFQTVSNCESLDDRLNVDWSIDKDIITIELTGRVGKEGKFCIKGLTV